MIDNKIDEKEWAEKERYLKNNERKNENGTEKRERLKWQLRKKQGR